jgi:hypothetical protein
MLLAITRGILANVLCVVSILDVRKRQDELNAENHAGQNSRPQLAASPFAPYGTRRLHRGSCRGAPNERNQSVMLQIRLSAREHALSTGASLGQWKSMSTILRAHPPHYRPITPASNIGSKSIRD